MTNYIYLLQEREFIKTNEKIYKVGMTQKENFERFNQYPKGSVLLFQIICHDCKNMEVQVIKQFKEKFITRKDIGSEYFEGNYKSMIDIIYSTVKGECEEENIITSVVEVNVKPISINKSKPNKLYYCRCCDTQSFTASHLRWAHEKKCGIIE
jgi:hypothetical protein